MSKLSDVLKSVYSSGDTYTILQLINKLIESVEHYESKRCALYQYKITGFVGVGIDELSFILPSDEVDILNEELSAIYYKKQLGCYAHYSATYYDIDYISGKLSELGDGGVIQYTLRSSGATTSGSITTAQSLKVQILPIVLGGE